MAVATLARCGGPSLRLRPGGQARASAGRPTAIVQRVGRPCAASPRAYYSRSSWDDSSMKELFDDMARQWKQQQGSVGGAFFWPGGGYVYGSGRCSPWQQQQQQQRQRQQQGDSQARVLPLDVAESADAFTLYADVPGLAKADLSIKLSKDRVLAISGTRQPPGQQQGGKERQEVGGGKHEEEGKAASGGPAWAQQERSFGAFERSWLLPEEADGEGISAKVSEGVLTIRVPKKQPEPEEPEQEIQIS